MLEINQVYLRQTGIYSLNLINETEKSPGQTLSLDYTRATHRILLPLLSQLHQWNIRVPSHAPCTCGWPHDPVLATDVYGDATRWDLGESFSEETAWHAPSALGHSDFPFLFSYIQK